MSDFLVGQVDSLWLIMYCSEQGSFIGRSPTAIHIPVSYVLGEELACPRRHNAVLSICMVWSLGRTPINLLFRDLVTFLFQNLWNYTMHLTITSIAVNRIRSMSLLLLLLLLHKVAITTERKCCYYISIFWSSFFLLELSDLISFLHLKRTSQNDLHSNGSDSSGYQKKDYRVQINCQLLTDVWVRSTISGAPYLENEACSPPCTCPQVAGRHSLWVLSAISPG